MSRGILVLVLAMTIVGLIGLVYTVRSGMDKQLRRVVKRVAWVMVWAGLAGLMLFVFSYERIPTLSMRALWIVWLAWLVWEGFRTWKQVTIELPEKSAQQKERDRLAKWLPKKRS